jgi:hypothetical protein
MSKCEVCKEPAQYTIDWNGNPSLTCLEHVPYDAEILSIAF